MASVWGKAFGAAFGNAFGRMAAVVQPEPPYVYVPHPATGYTAHGKHELVRQVKKRRSRRDEILFLTH